MDNYRAAVCLNNYGASLLERGQYRQAALVLRDSLNIMNVVLQSQQQEEDVVPLPFSVSDRLHFATKCMAESPMRKKSFQSDNIHVFRYDGAGSVPLDAALYSCTAAITIEDFDNHKDETDDNLRAEMDIHTAIIVYNTAMARLAMADASTTRHRCHNHHNKRSTVVKACLKLLRWAHAILRKALNDRPREATQLSVLILGKLVDLLEDAGENTEALRAAGVCESMKSKFEAIESLVPSRPDSAAAA
mmetsp:Transcript_4532/g.9131  ORF Transcript_4532/g.9131 Transcript_4532/m.9131 type:complete len:247 (+) Transcript_4532:109-849(+)|eukprot:scaffold34623_cov274-Amphora_coffeaeformis.AAC.16